MPSAGLKKGLPFIHGRIIIRRRAGRTSVFLRARRAGRAAPLIWRRWDQFISVSPVQRVGGLGQGNAHTQRCLCKAKVAWPRVPPTRRFSLARPSGIHNVSLLFPAAPVRTPRRATLLLPRRLSGFICCSSSSISDNVAG